MGFIKIVRPAPNWFTESIVGRISKSDWRQMVCKASQTANPGDKPLLVVDQQIAYLESKGVAFSLCSQAEAAEYLQYVNNYLRATSYRILFPRQIEGPRIGEYINLDFAHLADLASIDRHLRQALLAAAIDVEHFAKLAVLRRAEAEGEDGYAIVNDYLESLAHDARRRMLAGFKVRGGNDGRRDTYSGDLIEHYMNAYPIWVLFEICEFGTFVDFYRFCAERWNDRSMLDEHYVLKSVKAIRNASAHNCCIINGITSSGQAKGFPISEPITRALNEAGVKNTRTRRKKLGNLRIAQIAALLYSVETFCSTDAALRRNAGNFQQIKKHIQTSLPLYQANNGIVSSFDFIVKLIDIWLPAR